MIRKGKQTREQQLDRYLHDVYKEHVQLEIWEQKINNWIIRQFHNRLIQYLRKNQLFNALYFDTFYGGSYYDGLKVSKPDEYDINLQMKIPAKVNVISGRLYGYAQVQLLTESIADRLTGEHYYLSVSKVNSWFQAIVNSAVENMKQKKTKEKYKVIRVISSGPATTILLETIYKEEISIDFVPAFNFSSELWPDNCIKEPAGMELGFSVVPKPPTKDFERKDRNFRLSFSKQERLLIKNKQFLKPAIKLIKYLRDEETQTSLKSYYIKTVALLELKQYSYPVRRMSTAFLHMLKKLQSLIEAGNIPYYWNPNGFNLISDCLPELQQNLANRLARIIRHIEDFNLEEMSKFFNTK